MMAVKRPPSMARRRPRRGPRRRCRRGRRYLVACSARATTVGAADGGGRHGRPRRRGSARDGCGDGVTPRPGAYARRRTPVTVGPTRDMSGRCRGRGGVTPPRVGSALWSARSAERGRRPGPGSARPAVTPCRRRRRRAAGRHRAVRRPRRLHHPVRDARPRAGQEPGRPLLRAAGRRHHRVRRPGRQDRRRRHRRPVRRPGRPRGRRRAGRPGRPAHAGDAGAIAGAAPTVGADDPDAHRRQHRRGAGRRPAGRRRLHGHGRRGEHRQPAADRGPARRGAGRADHPRGHPRTSSRYEHRGLLTARGREEPVEAWSAVERPAAARATGPRRVDAPLVGRDAELGLLAPAVDAVAQPPAGPSLVLVVGDAGVGKTRLADEVGRRWPRASTTPVVLEGRCVPYGEANVWWPRRRGAAPGAASIEPTTTPTRSAPRCGPGSAAAPRRRRRRRRGRPASPTGCCT